MSNVDSDGLIHAVVAEARNHLAGVDQPLASSFLPVIYSLAGVAADELCIVERTEDQAHVHDGAKAAANAWQAPGWQGRERGEDSAGRTDQMLCDVVQAGGQMDADFSWLRPPILNARTRLAMTCDAARGRQIQGG